MPTLNIFNCIFSIIFLLMSDGITRWKFHLNIEFSWFVKKKKARRKLNIFPSESLSHTYYKQRSFFIVGFLNSIYYDDIWKCFKYTKFTWYIPCKSHHILLVIFKILADLPTLTVIINYSNFSLLESLMSIGSIVRWRKEYFQYWFLER